MKLHSGAALTAAILALLFAAPVNAQPAPDATSSATPAAPPPTKSAGSPALQIAVVGLRSDKGRVSCALFNDPKPFPRDGDGVFRQTWADIHGDSALCVFTDVPAGKYAAVVYHDENGNGHFDQNAFGMPLEGYGFSNNAAALFDTPSFTAASFDYGGQRLYTVIDIRY